MISFPCLGQLLYQHEFGSVAKTQFPYCHVDVQNRSAAAVAQDTPVILLDEPTAFLDLPNRYELCLLLKKLAQEEKKCVLFSTHDLDIALSLCDSIMLIDNPQMYTLPTPEMVASGHIERLFRNESVTFDVQEMRVRIK